MPKKKINKPVQTSKHLDTQLSQFSALVDKKEVKNHKIVGFANSSDIVMTNYVEQQLQLLTFLFKGLEVELSDELDSDLLLYTKYPTRLPAFVVFRNNSRKAVKQGKLNNIEFTEWVFSVIG